MKEAGDGLGARWLHERAITTELVDQASCFTVYVSFNFRLNLKKHHYYPHPPDKEISITKWDMNPVPTYSRLGWTETYIDQDH